MKRIIPSETPLPDLHQILVGSVAPRPIAFASTIDNEGFLNLAPYSFFNCFSSNPPTLIFSSNRKVSDNTTKDTLANIEANREVVINVVTQDMVHQMSLASISYASGISEFEKAGFTPIASETVKPFRVKESPVQFECIVKDIIPLGDQGGAGNLFVCEVQMIHIDENMFDEKDRIDPNKMNLVGRMGRAFYSKTNEDSIFRIYQPVNAIGVGVDQLPRTIVQSEVLTGKHIWQLARITQLPNNDGTLNPDLEKELSETNSENEQHEIIKSLLNQEQVDMAWKVIQHIYPNA
jgi:flavin reductase (DIM6/NTAB) family NADH-FMN oxidoreductase RutF